MSLPFFQFLSQSTFEYYFKLEVFVSKLLYNDYLDFYLRMIAPIYKF